MWNNNSLLLILIGIAVSILFSGVVTLLFPVLLVLFFLASSLGAAVFSAAWLKSGPKRIKELFTDVRARRNLAAMHAVTNLLLQEKNVAVSGWASSSGFFIENVSDETLIHETTMEAIQLLRNGNTDLAIYTKCPTCKILTNFLVILVLLLLLIASGRASSSTLLLAVFVAWLLEPATSRWLQRVLIKGINFSGMEVINATYREQQSTALGGRLSSVDCGVFVTTGSDDAPIEAEIVS